MEAKKTRRADLQNRRVLFIEIGLIIALAFVVGAFAWGQSEKVVERNLDVVAPVEEEIVLNTEQEQKQPDVKPLTNQVYTELLDIVKNDTQITTDFSLEDFSEDLVIEVPVIVAEAEEEIAIFDADDPATFMGGDANTAFRRWVMSPGRLTFPAVAAENGIQGIVKADFVIETDGTLSNIQILFSPHNSLSEETIRVLKMSPKWKPARHRNKPVRQRFIMDFNFQLENN